jgi:hypothetical protein
MENPVMFHQYGRTLERIEEIVLRKKFRTEMPVTKWYWGPTGAGKSHIAFQHWDSNDCYKFSHRDNGFWNNYTGQRKLVINEFRGEIPFAELLEICDKWPYDCKRKGKSSIPLLATEIIITSCDRPENIYKHSLSDNDKIGQLLRRIEIIELNERIE